VLAADVEHGLAGAVDQAVQVLHADDAGGQRLAQLVGGDAAQADAVDLALVPQRDQFRQLALDVDDLVALGDDAGPAVHAAQVDQGQPLRAQAGEVGLDARAQLVRPLGGHECAALVADRADLRGDRQVLGIGVQRGADQVVRVQGRGSVEVGGVDVVDAPLDRGPQDRDGGLPADRRAAEGLGQLHRAEADPGDAVRAQPARAARFPHCRVVAAHVPLLSGDGIVVEGSNRRSLRYGEHSRNGGSSASWWTRRQAPCARTRSAIGSG
jgi:hypothetical protein